MLLSSINCDNRGLEEVSEKGKGTFYGFAAYIFWSGLPFYWKLVPDVPAIEILCYRIVWSFIFMLLYIVISKKWTAFMEEIKTIFIDRKKLQVVILTSLLISINWFSFILSIGQKNVTEASLGYYINPLVNVLLATVFLREKLNRTGVIASLLAMLGVGQLIFQTGKIPWLAFTMALSFSLYGLLKKQVSISSYAALTLETFFTLPLALLYLIIFAKSGFMGYSVKIDFLLMGAGIVTAIPLLLFAESAKRISYILLGFIQYINPTLMLVWAVFVFHEPTSLNQFVAFGFIWLGILVFIYGSIKSYQKEQRYSRKI